MSDHTPTPWNYESKHKTIRGRNNRQVACYASITGSGEYARDKSIEEDQDNAAFIVRAVNCHEELIELAKELTEVVRESYSPLGKTLKALVYRAEKAIAKAENLI